MRIVLTIVLIALFGAMVGVALWAWVAAPPAARFPVQVGNPPSFDGTVGKRTGLVMWIVLGAIAFVGSIVTEEDLGLGLPVAGAGLLAFLLLMEINSVRRMMR